MWSQEIVYLGCVESRDSLYRITLLTVILSKKPYGLPGRARRALTKRVLFKIKRELVSIPLDFKGDKVLFSCLRTWVSSKRNYAFMLPLLLVSYLDIDLKFC